MKKLVLLFLVLITWPGIRAFTQVQTPVNFLLPAFTILPGQTSHNPDPKMNPALPEYPSGWWMQDSTWYSSWITATSAWYLYEKNFLSYTSNGSVAQSLYTQLNDVTHEWENLTRYVNVYYPTGNMQTTTGQTWYPAGAIWVEIMYYHYDYLGRMDTSVYMNYDRINNIFYSGSKWTYSFTASNMVAEAVYQTLDTAAFSWINNLRQEYTYDASNHLTVMIAQVWDTGLNDWVNNNKYEYTFDGSGFATGYIQYLWNTGAGTWENYKKAIYTNNASGMPTEKLYQLWDSVPDVWNNSERLTYQYNSYNQQTQVLDELADTASLTWSNYMKDTYSYFANHQPWEHYQYAWNPDTSVYMDVYYSLNDSTGLMLQYYSKFLDWLTYQYTGGYKYIYSYTPFNRPSEILQQLLDLGGYTWYDNSRTLYTYDGNENNTVEVDQIYDSGSDVWVNQFKRDHFYSFTTGIREIPGTQDYCFFANPVQAGTTVICPNLESGKNYSINLVNMQGQRVFSAIIHSGESFTVPQDLSTGMYLMQLVENGKLAASGKVIITK
jgi:hypothetical protein